MSGNMNMRAHQDQQSASEDILLNTFLINEKTHRVLLHYDKLICEKERNSKGNKILVSIYDVIAVKVSHRKKLSSIVRETVTKKTPVTQSSQSASSSSISFMINSTPNSYQSYVPSSTTRTNEISNNEDNIGNNINENHDEFGNNSTEQIRREEFETELCFLNIYYAKRMDNSKTKYNYFRNCLIKMYNSDFRIIKLWHETLKKLIRDQMRPRNILMFINPYGGRKNALKVYEKYAKPLMQLADINVNCIISQRANEIRDIIMTQSLDQYDAICCTGGDGTFSEVFNGLIFRAIKDSGLDPVRPLYIPKPKLPIGIIPAGSTDTVSYCLHGTTDIKTAVIHIVLGQKRGLDLSSVCNKNGLIKLFASVMSYGYLGDVAFDSENFRWMGPKRYDYSGFKKIIANNGYENEIFYLSDDNREININNARKTNFSTERSNQYLPSKSSYTDNKGNNVDTADDNTYENRKHSAMKSSSNSESSPEILKKCYVNCSTCIKVQNEFQIKSKNLTENTKYDNIELLKISNFKGPNNDDDFKDINIMVNDDNLLEENNTINYLLLTEDIMHENMKSVERIPIMHDEYNENEWKSIKGKFFMISGANISCSCSRTPNGIAPYSHLGDGYLNIVLIRHTSFFNNIRLLLTLIKEDSDIETLPFVERYRTKTFYIKSRKSLAFMDDQENSTTNVNSSRQPINYSSSNDNSCSGTGCGGTNSIFSNNDDDYRSSSNHIKTSQWNCDGEIIHDTNVLISSHCQLIDVFMRGPYPKRSKDKLSEKNCCYACCSCFKRNIPSP